VLDLEKDAPENYAMLANACALAGKKNEAESSTEHMLIAHCT